MKPLISLSALFALLIFTAPAIAEDNQVVPDEELPTLYEAVEDEEPVEEEKEIKKRTPRPSLQSIRHARKSPCLGMHGVALRRCIQINNQKVKKEESRRTQMLKRSSAGRRIMSLQNRLKNRTSVLDAPATPGKKVDLRVRTLRRMNLLRDRGSERSYANTSDGPLIRVRAKAGDRKTATSLPVCARRDGLRLIRCMQDMGVEINEETVDKDTWGIYKRIYMR